MTKEEIEGLGITYVEGMTDAQVIVEITKLRKGDADKIAELDGKVKAHKNTIDKYSSEIANFKKEKEAKLTDEEKAKVHLEELEASLAKANREIAESKKVASYVGIGYSKELAEKIAKAELDGKDATALHQEFLKVHDEALKAELMKNNPSLKGGGGNGGSDKFTRENFIKGKLSMEEVSALKDTNPALYRTILGLPNN